MIADAQNTSIGGTLNDAVKSFDPTSVLQGHVGDSVKQVFEIERTRLRHSKRVNMSMMEHICKDQFGNLYVVFITQLPDGEVWAVADWVGTEKWTETGEKTVVIVREYKKFKTFNDDLLAYLQDKAFVAFAKECLIWLKGQNAATVAASR